ncbi:MAG: hypothetical protein R6V62_01890 [Candidatus Fermentibacteraceae bacterium]
MRAKQLLLRMIEWGASIKASPMQLGGLFAATVILRNLLEAATLGILFEGPAFFLHFPIAYIFPMLGLVALLHLASGFPLSKLLKIMIMAWTLTLLPPIIDFLAGETGDIGYFPLHRGNAVWFLTNFFNPAVVLPGTTTGIRIEAFLGCVLAGVFSWCVGPDRRLLRGILTTLVFMPMFLVFFTWPYLVQILGEAFFPVQEITQRFLQWRAISELPLHGSAHFTIFTVDMMPVSLLALWMFSRLYPGQRALLRAELPKLLPGVVVAFSGALAVFASTPSGGITFADAVAIAGAFMGVLWLLGSLPLQGAVRSLAIAGSLLLGWASGWNTLVALSFATALFHLPGPRWLSRSLAFPVLLFASVSPAGIPAFTMPYIGLSLAASVLGGVSCAGKAGFRLAGSAAFPLLVLVLPPEGLDRGRLQGFERQADSFFRSGMVAHGHASASRFAASGGGLRTVAEGAHLSGMHNRAEWAYQVGTALGDSSPELMKVGVNLAFASGDSLLLWTRALAYMDTAGERGTEAAELLLGFSATTGDTAFLNRAHSGGALSDRLLVLYSRAQMALGDTLTSASYARAALTYPDAAQGTWAYAVELAGTAGDDYDSLFTVSVVKFGFSQEIALARLRVGFGNGGVPDREDLLNRCLALSPDNPAVLETAASWHLAANNPQLAMDFAIRSLAAQIVPAPNTFALAVRAAVAAGRNDIAVACGKYAQSVYR